jgi:hypothetical protein
MGKKLIAFDMYKTCLDIQGEENLIPLLSDIMKEHYYPS